LVVNTTSRQRREKKPGGDKTRGTANRRPDRQRPGLGSRARRRRDALDDGQRDAPEQHVDRIAWRMRLMQRRIEMAQSEREVDRIDVFE